jgi:predicted XRE-type DNA-binding protein
MPHSQPPKPNRRKHPALGTTATVGAFTATRTRKAGSPGARRKASPMRVAEQRDAALKLYLENVSQFDIAKALGVSQPRVSNLIAEAWEARRPQQEQTIERARELALARIDAFTGHWALKARSNIKAAEILLSWQTRADKIQGLYSSTLALTGEGGGPVRVAPAAFDLSLLTTAELETWERLMLKASGQLPPAEEPPPPVIMSPQPPPTMALLEDQRPPPAPVAAYAEFIPKPARPSLIDEILRLKAEGHHAYDISDRLGITRSALDAAVEKHNTQRLNAS